MRRTDERIQKQRRSVNKKGDAIIDIPTFRKFWIYDKPYGHDIVIYADTGKTTIQCRWPDRKRVANGRVKNDTGRQYRIRTTR